VLRAAVEPRAGRFRSGRLFIERLALWLSEMDADAERTGLGRAALWNDWRARRAQSAAHRALLNEHPEMERVATSARSSSWGSRAGHHASREPDAATPARSLPLWESQEPVPDRARRPARRGRSEYARSARGWEMMRANVPLLARCTR